MRRFLAILSGLILVAAIPAAATARPPIRESDHVLNVYCDALSTTAGTGIAFLGIFLSDRDGPDAYFDFWADGITDGAPDLSRDYGSPVAASLVGGTLTASFPLIDGTGDPAGSASLAAALTPAGESGSFDDSYRDGNTWFRASGTFQPMAVDGTLVAGGSTFALGACFAFDQVVSIFATQPNAYVSRFSEQSVGCELANSAGDTGLLFLDIAADGRTAFVGSDLFPADGSATLGAFGEIALAGGAGGGQLEVIDFDTGELVGMAIIEVSLAGGGEPFDFTVRARNVRLTFRGETIDVEGTLSYPGHQPFDLGACIGQASSTKQITTNPQGPKATGKAPANDLPQGAQPIRANGRVTQQTKSASPDREAPYPCLSFEDFETGEVFEIPVGNTVWFSVVGTGGDVTIDTAGSSFDTVAAAYVRTNGSLAPVACVDDVPLEPIGYSLQSAITFPTVAGTTYLVQIGGYPQGWPYGTLKVAVH